MTSFNQLGLSSNILKALSELGFETPSEIQVNSIPKLLNQDIDFIGLAQTGTGKTAAFGIPLIEKIDTGNNATQALILAPTRELGKQIAEQLQLYGKHSGKVNILPVYGGAAISNQIKDLKKPQHIVIATPGRLIDLLKRKALKLDQLRYLILDEADEMLNMGFKDEIDEILKHTRSEKNTWLFSATMPREIKHIVNTYMHNPLEVTVKGNIVNEDIEHQYAVIESKDRPEALTRFMDVNPDMRGVVFCRTKRDTQNLAEKLLQKNYKADALHGDLSQAQRDRVMRRFKNRELHLLIATDVAARGIDVSNLTHVFHLSLPDDVAYYTHRSGRTARAGRKGISLAFISGREVSYLKKISRQSNINFEKIMVPAAEAVASSRIERSLTDIKEQKVNGKVNPEIAQTAQLILKDLSKEELVEKIVAAELDNLEGRSGKNLNASEKDSGGGGGGSKRKYGGKRSGGGGNRYSKGKPFNKKGKGNFNKNKGRKRSGY